MGSGIFALCQMPEVLLPLDGKEGLLFGVALLAGGRDVAPARAAPADERDDVVHCQLAGVHLTPTVMAATGRQAPLPPLTLAENPSLRPLPAELGLRHAAHIGFGPHRPAHPTV